MQAKQQSQRLPEWLKVGLTRTERGAAVRGAIESGRLHTVCREARCPNRGECWDAGTATFLILGDRCARNCRYCGVAHGEPAPVERDEPLRILEAARKLKCKYIVVTSVTRDDLPDGGAGVFAEVVRMLRPGLPDAKVELLVPDFNGNFAAMETVAASQPDVLGHNLEVVERLFPSMRPLGSYRRSLRLLEHAAGIFQSLLLKSGIMVGLGETREEISQALRDLRSAGVSIVTVGQYLRPAAACAPVERYLHPDEFEEMRLEAVELGFRAAACGPLVRSSYRAAELAELARG